MHNKKFKLKTLLPTIGIFFNFKSIDSFDIMKYSFDRQFTGLKVCLQG